MGEIRRLDFEELDPGLREALRAKVDRLGYLGEFFAVGGHQPAATAAFQAFTEALKSAVDPELTEAVALCVATLLDNGYERVQHERLAVALGFSRAWVEAAVGQGDPAELSEGARTARALATAVVEGYGRGAAPVLAQAVDVLGEHDAVAVLLTVGRYVAHAVVSNTLELAPPVPGVLDTPGRSAGPVTAPSEELDRLRAEVAAACRVLAVEGLVSDILGHVSVRVGEDRMLIRARSGDDPGLLLSRPSDVVLCDLDGEPAEDLAGRQLPQELPIHGEVLRHRAGDGAVVHAHPPDVVLCSIAELPLEPVFGSFNIPAMRMADRGVPVFEFYGLVRSRERGEQMVAAMGDARVVLLRGHGLTSAAPTLAGAVVTALNLNLLARMTVALASMGRSAPPVPEADRVDLPDLGSGFNEQLVWQHHMAKLAHRGLAVDAAG